MKFASLFAGIGGFDLGFERAGMQCVAQVEIDKQARGVLARHFPNVRRFEDVTKTSGSDIGAIDLLCGGFPCQDLSIAGLRAGLAGRRSGLVWEFFCLADELRPRWLVIENVPGLLSSNRGRDMGAILGAMAERGYGFAFRVLDAQHFGLAQRRKRVFIVGHLGAPWSAPARVLLEPEGVRWDPPSRGKARQDVAGALGGGSGKRGWSDDLDRSGAFVTGDSGGGCAMPHPRGPL